MRLTQGAFSFLPDLTDEQIVKQVQYAISKGWALNVEFTDDPHPRNAYWDLWGLPLFGVKDPAAVMFEINSCRKAKPSFYVKVNAFDNSRGVESCCLSLYWFYVVWFSSYCFSSMEGYYIQLCFYRYS
jgi:ribulose-bisphosphate carboxylase small chain